MTARPFRLQGDPDHALPMLPRERLFERGPQALTEAEMLAVLLGSGSAGQSVMALAERLLQRFGDLGSLLQAEAAELLAVPGVGAAKAASLQVCLPLAERSVLGIARGIAVTDPLLAQRYVRLRLARRNREVFACLFLDNQHRLLAYEELFFGTINSATVHAREIVRQLLSHNAAAVIFAHNHPSGVAEPSQADQRLTSRLVAACDLVDARVLDHIVVGDEELVSFAERGLLN